MYFWVDLVSFQRAWFCSCIFIKLRHFIVDVVLSGYFQIFFNRSCMFSSSILGNFTWFLSFFFNFVFIRSHSVCFPDSLTCLCQYFVSHCANFLSYGDFLFFFFFKFQLFHFSTCFVFCSFHSMAESWGFSCFCLLVSFSCCGAGFIIILHVVILCPFCLPSISFMIIEVSCLSWFFFSWFYGQFLCLSTKFTWFVFLLLSLWEHFLNVFILF